jgi:hypothetical protein
MIGKTSTNGAAKPSYEELAAAYAAQQAEIDRLKSPTQSSLKLKVSEKGALSLYGLGRFPVPPYAAGWERILNAAEDIRAFIAANADQLSRK